MKAFWSKVKHGENREYPVSGGMDPNTSRPVDKQNYVLLLKELRRQLDAVTDKKYLLTAA